jgi:hypothetical protein
MSNELDLSWLDELKQPVATFVGQASTSNIPVRQIEEKVKVTLSEPSKTILGIHRRIDTHGNMSEQFPPIQAEEIEKSRTQRACEKVLSKTLDALRLYRITAKPMGTNTR